MARRPFRAPPAPPAAGGVLYVVATPIGNFADLSPRAAEILARVDVIAAEDTRITRTLLDHLGLDKPTLSFHDFNEASRTGSLVARIEEGQTIALVSDAGTPLVSDPGYRLVHKAVERGLAVVPVPGPCAAVAALSVSGLPSDRFLVVGFLPRRPADRRSELAALRREAATVVLFEAPHRVVETLADLIAVWGDRPAFLGRSLTKPHEATIRGSLTEIAARLGEEEVVRGEMTLVVGGAPAAEARQLSTEAERAIGQLLAHGLSARSVQELVTGIFDLPKKEVYRRVLEWVNEPPAGADRPE
jgi:16S rRNA (cytidine1402-2'-O)-methyltransferase